MLYSTPPGSPRPHRPAALLALALLCACRASPPAQVERRVPVDVIGDCVALRQRLSECPDEAADLYLLRRADRDPELARRLREPGAAAAARDEALGELRHEAERPEPERLQECRVATAETPLPSPEDVARLHRCLGLSCRQRIECLRPLLLPRQVRKAGALSVRVGGEPLVP